MNKRTVAILDLPLPHAFQPEPGGWRVQFSIAGDVVARLAPGGEQRVGVGAGDTLVASGDDLYLMRAA